MRGQLHFSAAIYPRERAGTHCTGGWVGPRAGLDKCGKSRHHRHSIPRPSSPYPVDIPTTLPGPCMVDIYITIDVKLFILLYVTFVRKDVSGCAAPSCSYIVVVLLNSARGTGVRTSSCAVFPLHIEAL